MATFHDADNGAGWTLSLKRVSAPGSRGGRPVLIVPGYGMNSFIFGFHPRGASMEEHLASSGLDVWSVDLRGQGRARSHAPSGKGSERYGLGELIDDVGVAVRRVLEIAGAEQLDLIGCSLGTALVFGYLASTRDAPVGSVVNFGGLVTWVKIHPALRALFASPWLAGSLNLRGTRRLAGFALPALVRHAPQVLALYMNTKSTDTSQAAVMVQTVEDPNPHVNKQIALWIAQRELVVRGVNVSRALASMRYPLLSVVANDDGIVPPETARWPHEHIGSSDKQILLLGTPDRPIAHADLFLATGAQATTFEVVAQFLLARQ